MLLDVCTGVKIVTDDEIRIIEKEIRLKRVIFSVLVLRSVSKPVTLIQYNTRLVSYRFGLTLDIS